MANKRISDLPEATSSTVGDVVAIDGTTTRKITVENLLDDNLVAIKGLTSAADKGIQFTGSGTAATFDLTAAGKALLDDADAAAQRTTLGLGSAAEADTGDFATAAQGAAADSAVQPGDPEAVPSGGTTGQVLAKASNTNGDTEWVDQTGGGSGVSSLNGQTGALAIPVLPGGRLTLTSGTPVMVTSVSGATTVYYTAYAGSYVPIYDGTNFVPTFITGGEISLATTDNTKSPAAVAATSYYDVFVWNDSGTLRLSRGPAWTNATTRSAGTALTLVNGIYLNSVSITNGPAASRGTYVGTIGSNGSSTIDFIYPAISTNGTAGVFNVWNCYNRVDVAGVCGMSAVSWTYNVADTWRAQNASTSFKISILRGLNEDGVNVNLLAQAQPPSGVNCACGIGLDSTTAATGRMMYVQSSVTLLLNMTAYYDGPPGLGFHTFYALELINAATTSTFYGSGGTNYVQTGLGIRFRA